MGKRIQQPTEPQVGTPEYSERLHQAKGRKVIDVTVEPHVPSARGLHAQLTP